MTHKRSKLLTFFFSLLPGAGEMYLGFLKQGVSIMTLFFGAISISSFLNFGSLLFFTPIIWFYSFFNANNLNSLPDDEFYSIEDDYVIHPSILCHKYGYTVKKYQSLCALGLIVIGISVLWNNVFGFLFRFLRDFLNIPDSVLYFIRHIANSLPQIVVGIAIIILGFSLIRGKKKGLDQITDSSHEH